MRSPQGLLDTSINRSRPDSGFVGAFLVGWIVSFVTDGGEGGATPEAFSSWGIIAAIVGACLVIWVVRLLIGGRSKTHMAKVKQ